MFVSEFAIYVSVLNRVLSALCTVLMFLFVCCFIPDIGHMSLLPQAELYLWSGYKNYMGNTHTEQEREP